MPSKEESATRGKGLDSTYEGLKPSRRGKMDRDKMRLDSTYEGLKRKERACSRLSKTRLDSTYEGLKLVMDEPPEPSRSLFGQYL